MGNVNQKQGLESLGDKCDTAWYFPEIDVAVRYLSGDVVRLSACRTVNDIKVQIANRCPDADVFAPNIKVFNLEAHELGDDVAPPAEVLVIVCPDIQRLNAEGWGQVLLAHSKAQDVIGVKRALEVGGKDDGGFALKRSARNGDAVAVTTLIRAKVDINAVGIFDEVVPHLTSALTDAALRGDSTILNMLLEANAEVDKKTEYGGTALLDAASMGQFDVMQTLLQAGSSVETVDNLGRTVLSETLAYGLERVASLYASDSTLSAYARIDDEMVPLIQLLIERGADVNVCDGGSSVLTLARHCGFKKVALLLQSAGAREN